MGEAPSLPDELTRLLAPAGEDVKAIRSFLPGKLLGRTAVVLGTFLAVFWYITPLHEALEKFVGFPLQPPWLWNSLLLGFPILIAIAQLVAEWVADWKRKQAQALAVKVDAVPEGYFRIGPYLDTPEDRAKFDRADRIHEKVLHWIKRVDATPLYLTGDSGSGKSSVLSAYALPELREAGWTVIEARAWQDPEAALNGAIEKLADAKKWRLGEAKTLRGLLEALAKRANERVLLVLDQFEEFVILAGSERQKDFTALIDDLRAKPIKGLKLLLVLRSDYKPALDELGLPLLRQGENWQHVGRFTIAAGMKFMARSGLALQPDALDRVATSASELDDSPALIRPITLNVVGHVLSEGRASAPSLDAGFLVRRYIEQSVEQPAIREIAPRVLKELVTEQGTKWPRSEKDLVEQTRLRLGEVRAVMNGLSTAALARPLDPAQGVWELSHDFVARAVSRYLGRQRIDWPGIVRAYAAPALFGLMVAAAAGAILWDIGALDRERAQLADLGIVVTSSKGGLAAEGGTGFDAKDVAKVVSLLSGVTGLRSLDLSRSNLVGDIGPLTDLKALQTLNLAGQGQVADFGPLKDLKALQSLDLAYTRVADIAPLKDLTALQSLDLGVTQVADIAPLKDLKALQSLDLNDDRRLADIAPLKDLIALQTLNLADTTVADIAPLKEMKALQTLYLENTRVVDIKPLKDLKALQSLNLGDTRVADIASLENLIALQTLELWNTQVADIGPLKDLIALQKLDLKSTSVADIRPLKDLKALQSLNLEDTRVTDIKPLKDLIALKFLNLIGTPVVDLAPLKDLTALEILRLEDTRVADLAPLQDLANLRNIVGAPVAALQTLNAYRSSKGLPTISGGN